MPEYLGYFFMLIFYLDCQFLGLAHEIFAILWQQHQAVLLGKQAVLRTLKAAAVNEGGGGKTLPIHSFPSPRTGACTINRPLITMHD